MFGQGQFGAQYVPFGYFQPPMDYRAQQQGYQQMYAPPQSAQIGRFETSYPQNKQLCVIRNKTTPHLCIDVRGAQKTNDVGVINWHNNGAANQVFRVEHTEKGSYVIASHSNLPLAFQSQTRGSELLQTNSSLLAVFNIVPQTDGFSLIRLSNTNLVWQLENKQRQAGTEIVLESENGSDSQKWIFSGK